MSKWKDVWGEYPQRRAWRYAEGPQGGRCSCQTGSHRSKWRTAAVSLSRSAACEEPRLRLGVRRQHWGRARGKGSWRQEAGQAQGQQGLRHKGEEWEAGPAEPHLWSSSAFWVCPEENGCGCQQPRHERKNMIPLSWSVGNVGNTARWLFSNL